MKALNGSGRAPKALTIEHVRKQGARGSIPLTNLNSVTVPGAAAAWIDTVNLFGSGNVSFSEVLDPAIRLAEQGYKLRTIIERSLTSCLITAYLYLSCMHML